MAYLQTDLIDLVVESDMRRHRKCVKKYTLLHFLFHRFQRKAVAVINVMVWERTYRGWALLTANSAMINETWAWIAACFWCCRLAVAGNN